MGILRDNWRFHTLTSPLLFSTDERESVLIRVNIFSSSMIFFSLRSKISHLTAQTHWTLDGVDIITFCFSEGEEGCDGNWQQIPKREYSPVMSCDVIRDM